MVSQSTALFYKDLLVHTHANMHVPVISFTNKEELAFRYLTISPKLYFEQIYGIPDNKDILALNTSLEF